MNFNFTSLLLGGHHFMPNPGYAQFRECCVNPSCGNSVEVLVLGVSRGQEMAYTSLSAGQMDCLKLLIASRNLEQIAAALGVSTPDVEQQLDDACLRLGVQTRLEAAMIATELGLIPRP